ncbi:hypothetical protein Q1695_015405 [Nippostrongylus brasiliensis]|nr:hypothetical protein Q1695_015405 [Nippostrongylus brasiliensis]
MLFIYVFLLAVGVQLSTGVPLRLVRIACAKDPTLSFCDSHILGDPVSRSSSTTSTTAKPEADRSSKSIPGYGKEEEEQFLVWLTDQKDEAPDVDTDEFETAHHKHTNIKDYCTKYKSNFNNYCMNSSVEKLEGVLPQFCAIYARHCGFEGDFPKPGALPIGKEDSAAKSSASDSGFFKGPVARYCDKFATQYKQFCQERVQPELGKADEFCASYRDSCLSSKSKSSSDVAKEIDDIDLPDPDEGGAGAQISESRESRPSKDSEVQEYCEKYWENFNFFCAGESSMENEKFCRSFRKNCPQKVGSLKESASFLGERHQGSESDRESSRSGDTLYLYKGTREEYCNKFAVNYEYYCTGESDNPEITLKFCPSYKRSCREALPGPANPFTKNAGTQSSPRRGGRVDPNFPDFDRPRSSRRRSRKRKPKAYKKPCTVDCDPKIHPHCTESCKCDYHYPFVQKFCNPPPLPLFLNTCRLWYSGCVKYERYHYASQFIYSKAEKGKRVELPVNSRPFSVISPNGERLPVVVRQPGVNTGSWDNPILRDSVNWSAPNPQRDDPLRDTVDWGTPIVLRPEDFETVSKDELEKFTKSQPGTAKPSSTIRAKDGPLPQRDDVGEKNAKTGKREKDTPIVPSDSVFSNAIQQYGSFTDQTGILHRPRSRSPFTKPGLWEANPDNPHNRDHANKWYYHPESVNVDWLSGQIAWGGHFAVPAAGVGGTMGFSTVHFPTIGTFAKIPDDYD